MVDKCANPDCAAQFRYLHQGKLFVVEGARKSTMRRSVEETNGVRARRTLIYWLCDACSKTMVIAIAPPNSINVLLQPTPPDE